MAPPSDVGRIGVALWVREGHYPLPCPTVKGEGPGPVPNPQVVVGVKLGALGGVGRR